MHARTKILLGTLIVITAMAILGHQGASEDAFEKWLAKYPRNYRGEQKQYRRRVFLDNLKLITQHNHLFHLGKSPYRLSLNHFADLTHLQFKLLHSHPLSRSAKHNCTNHTEVVPNPPDSIDWSPKYTTNVSEQGSCGASWAFAAVGALEGLFALNKGTRMKLSAQQLLDCSDEYGNQGCSGGLMDQGFWYVVDHGVTSEDQYPYTGQDQKCGYKDAMKVFQNGECATVPSGDFEKLRSAVIQQPISAAVSATTDPKWKFYQDGVYDGPCTEDIDAGILIIGYGKTDDGLEYWKLKNSVGTDWGINGTMLLSMGNKTDGPGKCGIQLFGTMPTNK